MLSNVHRDHVVSMPYALAQGKFEICETGMLSWCAHGLSVTHRTIHTRPDGRRLVPSCPFFQAG